MKLVSIATMTVALQIAGTTAVHADSNWEFSITPFVWVAGLDGDIGTIPGLPPGEVSLSFGDILDDFDYGGFLYATARNGPWVVFLEASAVQTTTNERVGGAVVDSVEVVSQTSNMALAVGRTISQSDQYNVDAYVGARAWWLDNDTKVRTQSATGLGKIKSSSNASWVDPLVGIAGQYAASDRWNLFGVAEVGGFGVGADLEWSVMAGATYAVTERFGLSLAWRYLSVDYDDGGIVYDVNQSGPLFGVTFRF